MNEYTQMVKDLAKPGKDIIAALTPEKAHLLHMAVGLSGEVGELLEHQLEKDVPGSTVVEELGDCEFYFEGLCYPYNISLVPPKSTFPYPISVIKLAVEAANTLDLIKKMVIYNKHIADDEIVNQLIKVRVALSHVEDYYGYSLMRVKEANTHKLLKGKNARYKDGKYSDTAAQERADKEGKD